MLNSDSIDAEARGYIRITEEMIRKMFEKGELKQPKKCMKWVSSLPLTNAMTRMSHDITPEKWRYLVKSSLISREEKRYIQTCDKDVLTYLREKYDVIMFSVYGSELKHWSLLVWYIGSENGFWHYDSLKHKGGIDWNLSTAESIVKFLHWTEVLPDKEYDIKMPRWMPTQPGGWECGHYCIITVFNLCLQYVETGSQPTSILEKDRAGLYNEKTIRSLWKQSS